MQSRREFHQTLIGSAIAFGLVEMLWSRDLFADPVKPAIVSPEARSDANWRGGFAAGFLDKDKHLTYAFTLVRSVGVFVNIDRVKDGELKSFADLLAPRWKGKIAISDPRVIGSTFWPLTVARLKLGDAIMKPLLRPGVASGWMRKAGSPLFVAGSTSRAQRRSLMTARLVSALAKKSSASAAACPNRCRAVASRVCKAIRVATP